MAQARGTVVASESEAMGIIDAGNAGDGQRQDGRYCSPASSPLVGQHLMTPYDAAWCGCVAHGDADDWPPAGAPRRMLATDLFSTLGRVVHQILIDCRP
ncbi:hypothetical protein MJ579_02940 [Klebsiella pneumoniae]|nr:hypothetical protein MJ579_02940 [Klebsiella pneumoniae]